MAEKQVPTRQRVLFFDGAASGTLAINQTLFAKAGQASSPAVPVAGMQQLTGYFSCSAAPAAGFPRICFNVNGSATKDIIVPLVQDTTQSGFVFPFVIPVFGDYAFFELTNGAGGVSTVEAEAWAYPDASGLVAFGASPSTINVLTKDALLTDMGYVQDTTTTNAAAVALQGVVAAVAAGATYVTIQCENFAVRWRSDGVSPTAAIGNLLLPGVTLTLNDAQLSAMKVIGTNAAASVLDIQYWK